jgi:hypothetical protein
MSSPSLAAAEAALSELRASSAAIDDDMFGSQLKLVSAVLSNAVAAARDGVNPARVSDIEFALNDLVGVVDQLKGADAAQVATAVQSLRTEVRHLKEAVSLPADVVSAIQNLQSKLRTRRAAIERQTYAAGGAEPLPHAPAELRQSALPLRERLAAAGFSVPALDALIESPDDFRLHRVNDLMNELDVVLG